MTNLKGASKASGDKEKSVRLIGFALAVGMLCAGLGGCVSDTGAPVASASQTDSSSPHLHYVGGPKSPMWPDR